ncbi:MAG: hypothetical protein SFW36_09065 [Leptolyngbyaceae cyanobacterium bins.59]|nr:hypothetical protein [Leptolyngbyaceae cyanobacterium bins.59]
MNYFASPEVTIFLALLGLTIFIWVLRGFALLAFLPSSILWILLFLTVGMGVWVALQWTR